MSPFCRFAAKETALATGWADDVVTKLTWTKGEKIGRGESDPFHVTSDTGIRAAAKPAFQAITGTPRAAHEKIAADLAHLVGVPVPAAILWQNPVNSTLFSISAWGFPQALDWEEATAMHVPFSQLWLENALPIISAGVVFHTWIGDTDRSAGNLIYDVDSDENHPGLAFIDHSASMSHHWAGGKLALTPIRHAYFPRPERVQSAVAQVVSNVRHLRETEVRRIVNRVPDMFLPSDRRALIVENLLRRREELGAVFNVC